MADIVGVLAESTNTSVATHTIGTVPTGKAWVFKFMYSFLANAGGATGITLTVNGINVMVNSVAAGQYGWSSTAALEEEGATYPTGEDAANTVAPGPVTYYASAGDTVTMTIATNAAQSMNMQLVGSSVDVA